MSDQLQNNARILLSTCQPMKTVIEKFGSLSSEKEFIFTDIICVFQRKHIFREMTIEYFHYLVLGISRIEMKNLKDNNQIKSSNQFVGRTKISIT